jgi:hypothetical protein
MIERDFFIAIERRQRSLAENHAAQFHEPASRRHAGHWLSVLMAGWWPSRSA